MFVRVLTAVALLCAPASAETVYIDFGSAPPPPTYGALAGSPGVWNALPFAANGAWLSVVDAQGAPGPVQMMLDWGCDPGTCPVPPAGDDGALLGDWFNADCYATQHVLFVRGLAPGLYRLRVYGFGESACGASIPQMLSASTSSAFYRGEIQPWAGALSGTHIEFLTTVTAAVDLRIDFGAGSYSGPAGIQIEPLSGDIATYCFGAQGACPCASSNGSTTGGCATSFSAFGGSITAFGSPVVGSDTLTLSASSMSFAAATLIQGTAMWNAQYTFGDGMRCVDGTITRLVTRFAPGGTLVYPQAGDPPLSVAGLIPFGGGTRFYQGWFRDSASFCTTATFNLTSAVAVVWH